MSPKIHVIKFLKKERAKGCIPGQEVGQAWSELKDGIVEAVSRESLS